MTRVIRTGRVRVLSFGEKDKPQPGGPLQQALANVAAVEAVRKLGAKTQAGPLETIAIRTDPLNGLGAVYMRTLDGQEFEHGVSSTLAIRLAHDLLKNAFKQRAEPQLLLAINAIKPFAL
ncbi:MAG: hypothetical protein AB7I36_08385 [Rhodospirillaceae bacterium]